MKRIDPGSLFKRGGLIGGWGSVFTISLLICLLVAAIGIIRPDAAAGAIRSITTYVLDAFDWVFLLSVTFFIVLSLLLALSDYGDLKLGKEEDEPEFSMISWLSMLFAAGMGAGLLFWGVAEPLSHYMVPPPGKEAMTPEAARWAFVVTNFHWGLHAWCIYGLFALIMGFFGFRHGYPMLAGSPFLAVFTGKTGHLIARIANIIAVLAVVFGISGSLGLGVKQISAGMAEVFGTSGESDLILMNILGVLTACYILSASTGLDKGIRFLSNLNMSLVVLLMLFVLFVGPTRFILSTFATSLGGYLAALPALSLKLYPFTGESEWIRTWTLTWMIWWIAWAPFVGVFIARISRGRTIRQFVLMVMLIPTLFSVLWFSVLGGTSMYLELFGQVNLGSVVVENPSEALFSLFTYFPGSNILSIAAVFLIFIFLVTSADSGAFVLGMMTSEGDLNPPLFRKLFWGAAVAVITGAGLFAGGSIEVFRAIAICGAIPFTLIMIAQVFLLLRALSWERISQKATGGGEAEERRIPGNLAAKSGIDGEKELS
ncbi:MAG: BCCT family transporter [Thermodesulfobacteriota bacterium]